MWGTVLGTESELEAILWNCDSPRPSSLSRLRTCCCVYSLEVRAARRERGEEKKRRKERRKKVADPDAQKATQSSADIKLHSPLQTSDETQRRARIMRPFLPVPTVVNLRTNEGPP